MVRLSVYLRRPGLIALHLYSKAPASSSTAGAPTVVGVINPVGDVFRPLHASAGTHNANTTRSNAWAAGWQADLATEPRREGSVHHCASTDAAIDVPNGTRKSKYNCCADAWCEAERAHQYARQQHSVTSEGRLLTGHSLTSAILFR